jgi:hypothetical protein
MEGRQLAAELAAVPLPDLATGPPETEAAVAGLGAATAPAVAAVLAAAERTSQLTGAGGVLESYLLCSMTSSAPTQPAQAWSGTPVCASCAHGQRQESAMLADVDLRSHANQAHRRTSGARALTLQTHIRRCLMPCRRDGAAADAGGCGRRPDRPAGAAGGLPGVAAVARAARCDCRRPRQGEACCSMSQGQLGHKRSC